MTRDELITALNQDRSRLWSENARLRLENQKLRRMLAGTPSPDDVPTEPSIVAAGEAKVEASFAHPLECECATCDIDLELDEVP